MVASSKRGIRILLFFIYMYYTEHMSKRDWERHVILSYNVLFSLDSQISASLSLHPMQHFPISCLGHQHSGAGPDTELCSRENQSPGSRSAP